jgi:hypothetical protein
MGRTGVGKSSFINSAFGIDTPTDPYEACTKVVEYYSRDTPFGEVRLFDSPGLAEQDGRHDHVYLDMVKDRMQTVHLEAMIYITPLNETRFREEEQHTIERLTTQLGGRIWNSSWLALTFAASVTPERRDEAANHRSDSIAIFLRDLTSKVGRGPRFDGFRNILLIDNVVPRWSPRCQPLLTFFR